MASGELENYVQLRSVIGSRAYGLEHSESDTDRRGFFLPPADLHWSLVGVPEQLENEATQETFWEIGKFLKLALKANPNVLECLYSPVVEFATPIAQELISMRSIFLSKQLHDTYNGYVSSHFRKLAADIRQRGEPKWKHVMHLLRLLIGGIIALEQNHVVVTVGEHRDRLLAVRRGEVQWIEIELWYAELQSRFDSALASTTLPDQPDVEQANAYLIRARRSAL